MSAKEEKNKSLKNCMKEVIESMKVNSNLKSKTSQHNLDPFDRTQSVPSLLKNVDKSIYMHQSTIFAREKVDNTEDVYKE
jgi:hypothetical protein